ncbi:SpoVG family protein [Lachnospiraceae bacterium MD329]|nr:SpoVG family protein [Lachnospiraceae bacterium MD329]
MNYIRGVKKSMELKASVNLYTKPGSLKGFASLSIDDAFVIRNLSVRESENGLFVSMPSQKVGGEYKDICYPITKELREEINKVVLEEYQQELINFRDQLNEQTKGTDVKQGGSKQKSSKSQKASAGQKDDVPQNDETEQD